MKKQNEEWLKSVFEQAAGDFVDRALGADRRLIPISDWEIHKLREGHETGLVKLGGSRFTLSGDNKPYSLFTLNREYLTQVAEYVRLISEDGFEPENVKFEYKGLDLVVLDEKGPKIAIEVKVSARSGETLKTKMLNLLPAPKFPENDRGNDPIRKIRCLINLKPKEFWIVTQSTSWRFRATYPAPDQLVLTELG